ncbi:alpha/beta fold hydrolase [Cerasicoccus frondis]|uniref:alpha/beta fold hydrolase n=1 Tax=Cerasicoccus frondis TaxID=490090 RepID=UPI002852491B|nr:alpha/beta hydrolase [Cerasicoccus frondis]
MTHTLPNSLARACALLALTCTALFADVRLEKVDYPFPVKTFAFESQQQPLEMVYMDIPAKGEPKGVVVMFHGKNFNGSYFEQTAKDLSQAGYRVVLPDQIGFGKSSKPQHYQFTFQQLAENNHALLKELGIEKFQLLGHSMGGMLATRYALMYPEQVESLTLLNPIGLEDWKAKGVPYLSVDQWYASELKKSADKIKTYQLDSYYDGKWKPAYQPWVDQLVYFIESPDYSLMAWDQALTYDMIYTQPVVYEFPELTMPTLLIIGQRDTTALGKNLVSPEQKKLLGNYPALGRAAHEAIPDSELVEIPGIGHLPHIEAYDQFIGPYEAFLDKHN